MKCSECGKESEGRFCARCGASLEGARCGACDAPLPAGARFCTKCGRPVASRPTSLPWLVAGSALVALIAVLAWPAVRERLQSAPPAGGAPFASMGGSAPPALTGTPREQADRLFNRVMEERSAGNDDQARFFAGMAVQAYGLAEPLDHDALFHVSLLEAAQGDGPAAVAAAERILAQSPNHLLALAAAAEGSMLSGDTVAARGYFTRFLEHYDAESDRALPEYLDHGRVLPEYRKTAEALTGR